MKTKELIQMLQEADPSGEEQCCINNADIWDITVEPAYYDGSLNVIEFDEDRRPLRGRRVRSGKKVNLTPICIGDCLEYPNFTIVYADDADRQRNETWDVEARRQNDQIEIDIDREYFVNWVFMKIQTIRKVPVGWIDRIKKAASDFYDANGFGPDNPFTVVREGRSYHDCREEYFESAFFVNWDDYSRIIIERK
jgi:hypothetical protein